MVLFFAGLLVTGGHDNVILVWTLDSVGKLINAAHDYTTDCNHGLDNFAKQIRRPLFEAKIY